MTQKSILHSNPKVATQTSDRKKRKVTDTSAVNLQQTSLINRTLTIITMRIDTQIPDRIANCGGKSHAGTMPTTKGVITNAVRSSPHIIQTPGIISRMGRVGTTPRDGDFVIRPPQGNSPILIGGTPVSPTCGIMASQEIFNKHGSTGSAEIRDTQTFDISIDGNLAENGYFTPNFIKVTGL